MITRLFVLWRDPQDRTRHVIGHLWRGDDAKFYFAYEGDLSQARARGFRSLPQFPETRSRTEPYVSPYLFSTFLQRIPHPARPDYLKALEEIGVTAGDDQLEVLARSGGVLVTDAIELAEFRADEDGLASPLTFRLAGERFQPGATARLQEQDQIELAREAGNAHDASATVVLCVDGRKIGYVPRYYAKMIASVLDGGSKVRGIAERRIRMLDETRWVIRVWKSMGSAF